jgi:flagellin
MGLRINTNVQSLAAQRTLGNTNDAQAQSIGKLASGQRIVKASDDAAGLAISEKLKARIRGTSQAERNANDGISLIQTAEGGLNEVSNILIRLRELAIQSASDTVGNEEREFTDLEYQNLKTEIDRISQTTEFNGKKLLSGGGDRYDFQIGTENRQGLDRISYDAADLDSGLTSLFGGQEVSDAQLDLQTQLEEINSSNSYETEAERETARIDAQESYKRKPFCCQFSNSRYRLCGRNCPKCKTEHSVQCR